MAFTQQQLDDLLTAREAEGLYLEFKRGAALSPADGPRQELIKDCTGFANAAGGRIIYGVVEDEVDGVKVAAALDPVIDTRATQDWIAEVLRSNTSPPLTRFHISELAQPTGGRVVVVDVDAGSTAHQNLKDHRYYQRAGAVTAPMVDFQIRDVMGRRTRPNARVDVLVPREERPRPDLHRYRLEILLENIGPVTLEKWWLEVDVPHEVVKDTRMPGQQAVEMQFNYHRIVRERMVENRRIARVSFGDPGHHGERTLLHPGQQLVLDRTNVRFVHILLEVDNDNFRQVEGTPIRWRLYLQNHEPLTGTVPFEDWCRF